MYTRKFNNVKFAVNKNVVGKAFNPSPSDKVELYIAETNIANKQNLSLKINDTATIFNITDSGNSRIGTLNGNNIGTVSDNVGITIRSKVSDITGTAGSYPIPQPLQLALQLYNPTNQVDISLDGTTSTTVHFPVTSGSSVIALSNLTSLAGDASIGSHGLYSAASTFTIPFPDANYAEIVGLQQNISNTVNFKFAFVVNTDTIVTNSSTPQLTYQNYIRGNELSNADFGAIFLKTPAISATTIEEKSFDGKLSYKNNMVQTPVQTNIYTHGDIYANLWDEIDIYFYSMDGETFTLFGQTYVEPGLTLTELGL